MAGYRAIFTALRLLLKRPRILRWLVPPFLITVVLDVLAFYFAFGWLRDGIASLVSGDGFMSWVRTALDVVGGLAVLFILGWTFSWLFLTLTSPFQDYISAEVEQELTGKVGAEPPGLRGFARSIVQSLIQAVVFSVITVFFLVLGFIPVIGAILLFIWTSFALGYSFATVPSGRMAHGFSRRIAFARQNRGAVFGLGTVITAATLLPILNIVLLPVFVIAGTVLHIKGTNSR